MRKPPLEALSLVGTLTEADDFSMSRCYSTGVIAAKPDGSAYVVETVDARSQILDRAPLVVEELCVMGGNPLRRVSGQVLLKPAAVEVRVRAESRTLWRSDVLERPTLAMECSVAELSRDRPLDLHFAYSTPHGGALLQIFFESSASRSLVVEAMVPQRRYTLDLKSLPGGKRCRVWAHYCNGMRSAVASSPSFNLPPLPASVRILEPARGAKLRFGQPLEMAGQTVDVQSASNARRQDQLVWLLDGRRVGSGSVACVMQPSPGKHTIELVDEHRSGRDAVSIQVLAGRRAVPADQWDSRT